MNNHLATNLKQKWLKLYGHLQDNIIWILLVAYIMFEKVFHPADRMIARFGRHLAKNHIISTEMGFTFLYLSFIASLVGLILILLLTKRNRQVLKTFLPGYGNNNWKMLLLGLLLGFVTNGACILIAFLHGDLHFYLSFTISQLPYYLFTLVCVFIQSGTEELWTRGFIYERLKVKYPEWVGILANALFFALLHIDNNGVTPLALIDIAVVGISYSLVKKATNSIWVPMGIHTMWNFTQNFIFGLPNSGVVSQASIWSLQSSTNSWAYDTSFGIEAGITSMLVHAALGVAALFIIYRQKKKKQRLTQQDQTPQSLEHAQSPI